MVQCIVAFMDFCYLARRPSHTLETLQAMEEALERFHEYRVVFEEVGVRPDGFSLPRQHSLVHYVASIKLFESPNGLCSSITESRHITAVKRPWRRSGRNKKSLIYILRTNVRLSKLAALRVKFTSLRMMDHDLLTAAHLAAGLAPPEDDATAAGHGAQAPAVPDDEDDVGDVDGPRTQTFVRLSKRAGT